MWPSVQPSNTHSIKPQFIHLSIPPCISPPSVIHSEICTPPFLCHYLSISLSSTQQCVHYLYLNLSFLPPIQTSVITQSFAFNHSSIIQPSAVSTILQSIIHPLPLHHPSSIQKSVHPLIDPFIHLPSALRPSHIHYFIIHLAMKLMIIYLSLFIYLLSTQQFVVCIHY